MFDGRGTVLTNEFEVGIVKLVSVPLGVIRPISSAPSSLNQRFPSGPAVIPFEPPPETQVADPDGVMRSIPLPVNQTFPSGPAVIPPTSPSNETPLPHAATRNSDTELPKALSVLTAR